MKKIFSWLIVLLAAVPLALPVAYAAVTYPLKIILGGHGAKTKTGGFNNLSPSTIKGDVIGHNGTDNVRCGVGADGTFMRADSSQVCGFGWQIGSASGKMVTFPYSGAATGDTSGVASGIAPSFTFTVPASVSKLVVCGRGGGGGGGAGTISGSYPLSAGGGGGGAMTSCVPIVVTPSTAYTVTVGAGGAGGPGIVSIGSVGTVGGTSSFGSLATFKGGAAGLGGQIVPDVFWYTNNGYGVGGGGHGGPGGYTTASVSISCGATGAGSAAAAGGTSPFSCRCWTGGGGGAGDGAGGNAGNGYDGSNSATAPTDGTNGGGGGGSAACNGGYTGTLGCCAFPGGRGGDGRVLVYWVQ